MIFFAWSFFGETTRNSAIIRMATPTVCKTLAPSPRTKTPKPVEIRSDAQPMKAVRDTGPVAIACILKNRNAAVTTP